MIGAYILILYLILSIYPAFSKGFDMLIQDIMEVAKTSIIMLTILLAKLIKMGKWIKNFLKNQRKSVGRI